MVYSRSCPPRSAQRSTAPLRGRALQRIRPVEVCRRGCVWGTVAPGSADVRQSVLAQCGGYSDVYEKEYRRREGDERDCREKCSDLWDTECVFLCLRCKARCDAPKDPECERFAYHTWQQRLKREQARDLYDKLIRAK
jgi:hypothetical protein